MSPDERTPLTWREMAHIALGFLLSGLASVAVLKVMFYFWERAA